MGSSRVTVIIYSTFSFFVFSTVTTILFSPTLKESAPETDMTLAFLTGTAFTVSEAVLFGTDNEYSQTDESKYGVICLPFTDKSDSVFEITL